MIAVSRSVLASLAILTLWTPQVSAITFTQVTTGPVVSDGGNSRSVNFVDIDNDGYPDIFFGNGRPNVGPDPVNYLYRNNGDGTFSRITNDTIATLPSSSDGTTWGDYDNDGDLDCYVTTWRGEVDRFFINNGTGSFTRDTTMVIVADTNWSDVATWNDYDNDGRLDLLVSVGFSTPLAKLLFHADSLGGFTKVASPPLTTDGDRSHGLAWADYDNDGDLDVFVTNVDQKNALYRNEGAGVFIRVNAPPFNTDIATSIRCVWGDIDNDGDFDLFVSNTNGQNEFEYLNNGDGTFTKVTSGPQVNDGAWSNSIGLFDVDNDGDLDLFVTVGFQVGQVNNRLYYNNGDGTFVRELAGPLVNDIGWTHGFACDDIDRDGDLDIVCAKNQNENQNNSFFLNDGNSNHWLNISCQGIKSPRDGNGVRIRVRATIGGVPKWQMRELCSPTGFGLTGLHAHFGLGDAAVLDTLEIRWPAGTKDYYFNVSVDQFLSFVECQDPDADGVGCGDNCPATANPIQEDSNNDGVGDACCCVGLTGNVDCDPGNGVDISDLSALIDYLYITFSPLCCVKSANIDGDVSGGIDISDLSALIDYRYISFTPTASCQ